MNTTFVAEPVGNLVHVDRLKSDGSTFIASRLQAKKELRRLRKQQQFADGI